MKTNYKVNDSLPRTVTAEDDPGADLIRWRVLGSDDGNSWSPLHEQYAQNDYSTPEERRTELPWFTIQYSEEQLRCAELVLAGCCLRG